MDDGVVLLLIYAVFMTCAGLVFCVGWWRNWRRVRELERLMLERLLPPEAGPEDELARQLTALAGQVDRLEEGQEFLARMVAEQAPRRSRLLGDLPRPVTPH